LTINNCGTKQNTIDTINHTAAEFYSHFHIKKYVFHIFSPPILRYICSISKLDSKEVTAIKIGDTRPIIINFIIDSIRIPKKSYNTTMKNILWNDIVVPHFLIYQNNSSHLTCFFRAQISIGEAILFPAS